MILRFYTRARHLFLFTMLHKRFPHTLTFLAFALTVFFPFASLSSEPLSSSDPLKFNPRTIEIYENLFFPADSPIGKTDAPVTIVDYSSFSCTHCKAAFEKLMLPTYESYVKTGKVVLIMRDFPLDNLSFNASVFLDCYRRNNLVDEEQTLELVKKLFELGSDARNKEEADIMLEDIISGFDLDNDKKAELRSCMGKPEVKDAVLYSKLFGIKELGITGTPVIFINGERYSGPFKFSSFAGKIEEALHKGITPK